MKIVINACCGGFGMSDEAIRMYKRKIKDKSNFEIPDNFFSGNANIEKKIPRYDPCLIETVQELGKQANDSNSCLKIVEIKDDIHWVIQEYDGYEWVAQSHEILTYYPADDDEIVCGWGTNSQGVYHPNKKNGFCRYDPVSKKTIYNSDEE